MKEIKFMAWPDTHIPDHDPRAVEVALAIMQYYKPDKVVILGDFMDCAPVSHWLKDRNKTKEGLRLVKDFAIANKLLDTIGKMTKEIIYLEGNHEDWLRDAIERKPEYEGLIDLGVNLKFKERGITQVYEYGACINIGKLWFTHGTYTGVGHARKHVEKYHRSLIYGHLHDVCSATEVSPIDVEDKHTAYCVGCLCSQNPKFMENKPNNWVQAVGLGLVRADGSFGVDTIQFSNHVASYDGRTFKG